MGAHAFLDIRFSLPGSKLSSFVRSPQWGDSWLDLPEYDLIAVTHSPTRRALLLAAALCPLLEKMTVQAAVIPKSAQSPSRDDAALEKLERVSGGHLGVYAIDTDSGRQIRHRADQRFPFCSTFKVILVAAILAREAKAPGYLAHRIHYAQRDLVHYSPVTLMHVSDGLTIAELCAAALQHSDNTSANLLMKLLGGPAAVTRFARAIGDSHFRLDRWETELNSAIPGDPRDTTTPFAMAGSLRALALGEVLPAPQRARLVDWLRGNRTGSNRIGAALPPGWQMGDKTGTGDYGTTNDIAVLWPPARKPIVVALYHTQMAADAKTREDVVAAAAKIVIDTLASAP